MKFSAAVTKAIKGKDLKVGGKPATIFPGYYSGEIVLRIEIGTNQGYLKIVSEEEFLSNLQKGIYK